VLRKRFTSVIAIIASIIGFAVASPAQEVSLQDQLAAQYRLVKMGSDTSGYSVTEEGTLLAIQKGGLLGIPYKDTSLLTNKYENGVVHPPSVAIRKGTDWLRKKFNQDEQTTKLFKVGDKVYPSKIEVNAAKDTVTMGIVACDTCNNTDPATYNKAQIIFQFPRGSLANANAGQVEDTIGQLLAVSDSKSDDEQAKNAQADAHADDHQQNDQQQNDQQQNEQGNAQEADQSQPQPAAQAEPQTIQLGQTPDQVKAILGKPDKDVSLGVKEIYIYKDMKITFKDGKVSDVQ
jgi:hypothetical protein